MKKLASGIYKIEDVETGSVYVGSADQANGIKKRWSNHSSRLKNNEYEYEELQQAYNDNSDRIKWEILADTSDMKFKNSEEENAYLEELERYYVNYCNLVEGWTVINKDKKITRKGKVKDKRKMIEAQTGEGNGHNTKLKVEDVIEIKKLLGQGKMTQKNIANKYNVSKTLIYNIKNGTRWASVILENKKVESIGVDTTSDATANSINVFN